MKEEVNIWTEKIKSLIAKGNTEEAIELFLSCTKKKKALSDIRKQVLLIANRYRRFEKKERVGVLSLNDNTLEIVNHCLIEVLTETENIQNSRDDSTREINLTRQESLKPELLISKGVLKDSNLVIEKLYKDLGEPIFKQIGKALGTSIGLINTLILPIEYMNKVAYANFRRNVEKYSKKLGEIDPSNIVEAPQEITVPILEKLFYIRNEELVNLFTNLLVRSSSLEECHLAHPNFVNMVSALSPDEARILNYTKGKAIYAIYPKMIENYTDGTPDYFTERNRRIYYTGLEDKINIIFPQNITLYFDNLFSLGISDMFSTIIAENFVEINKSFNELEARYQNELTAYFMKNKKEGIETRSFAEGGKFSFTDFGKLFISACCD